MKKYFLSLLLVVLFPALVFAAGTVTCSENKIANNIMEITWDWTADSSDGSVPESTTTKAVTGYIILAETDPGSTAPTDNYDITINYSVDGTRIDVMGAELANRDTADCEQALPCIDSTATKRYIPNKVLCFKLLNNTTASATGFCRILVETSLP